MPELPRDPADRVGARPGERRCCGGAEREHRRDGAGRREACRGHRLPGAQRHPGDRNAWGCREEEGATIAGGGQRRRHEVLPLLMRQAVLVMQEPSGGFRICGPLWESNNFHRIRLLNKNRH
jgi:hypothetical protein